jgi:hypothetical protein
MRARLQRPLGLARPLPGGTMVDLKTTFMGIPLRSPLVVGASSVSGMVIFYSL